MHTLIIIINQSATCFGLTGSLLLNKNIYANIQPPTISSTLDQLHVPLSMSVIVSLDMSDCNPSSSSHHDSHMFV